MSGTGDPEVPGSVLDHAQELVLDKLLLDPREPPTFIEEDPGDARPLTRRNPGSLPGGTLSTTAADWDRSDTTSASHSGAGCVRPSSKGQSCPPARSEFHIVLAQLEAIHQRDLASLRSSLEAQHPVWRPPLSCEDSTTQHILIKTPNGGVPEGFELRSTAVATPHSMEGRAPPSTEPPDVVKDANDSKIPGHPHAHCSDDPGAYQLSRASHLSANSLEDFGEGDQPRTSLNSNDSEIPASGGSSPVKERVDLKIRGAWEQVVTASSYQKRPNFKRSQIKEAHSFFLDSLVEADKKHFCHRCVSPPGSHCRLVLDFLGALLIVYDLIAIPLQAFDPPHTLFNSTMNWVTLIFWTMNMMLATTAGYVKDGVQFMDPKKILARYLRTWFLIDVMVVVPDWVFTLASLSESSEESTDSAQSSFRLFRMVRFIRMFRLLRLFKLMKVVQEVFEMIDSEYVSIIANIVKMVVFLLMINHVIACLWFTVARSVDGVDTPNWLVAHGFDDSHWTYQYLTAFHWSITQFTPSSMHVQPHNTGERLFAVAVVTFALVGFSYLVGSITGSLTQLRSMQENASKQFWMLRRYLKRNNLEPVLSLRIRKYLEHAWRRQQETLSDGDIKILSLLSEQLMGELHSELAAPHLAIHPLFKRLKTVSSATVHRLSNNAISRKLLASNDNLFFAGEQATHMYMVISGRLRYIKLASDGDDKVEQVDKGEDWIAEPVLWTTGWIHLGQLVSTEECELLLVEPQKFGDIIQFNPTALQLCIMYAHNFLDWQRCVDPPERSDISQGEDVGALVHGFMGLQLQRSWTQEFSMSPASTTASHKLFRSITQAFPH